MCVSYVYYPIHNIYNTYKLIYILYIIYYKRYYMYMYIYVCVRDCDYLWFSGCPTNIRTIFNNNNNHNYNETDNGIYTNFNYYAIRI